MLLKKKKKENYLDPRSILLEYYWHATHYMNCIIQKTFLAILERKHKDQDSIHHKIDQITEVKALDSLPMKILMSYLSS